MEAPYFKMVLKVTFNEFLGLIKFICAISVIC